MSEKCSVTYTKGKPRRKWVLGYCRRWPSEINSVCAHGLFSFLSAHCPSALTWSIPSADGHHAECYKISGFHTKRNSIRVKYIKACAYRFYYDFLQPGFTKLSDAGKGITHVPFRTRQGVRKTKPPRLHQDNAFWKQKAHLSEVKHRSSPPASMPGDNLLYVSPLGDVRCWGGRPCKSHLFMNLAWQRFSS